METLSVLVVDDEPGIRSGILRILSGHQVSFPFMDDDYVLHSCLAWRLDRSQSYAGLFDEPV